MLTMVAAVLILTSGAAPASANVGDGASGVGSVVAAGVEAAVAPAAPRRRPRSRPSAPRTFVPLEAHRFPRRAQAACRDNTDVLRVPSRRFPSISRALAAARPGSRVVVAPGRYTENRGEWFALSLVTPNVCLLARRGTVTLNAAPGQEYGLQLPASRAVVAGVDLDGFRYGVALGRDDSGTQRLVTLQRMRIRAAGNQWTEGIVAYPDHRATSTPVVAGLLLDQVRISGTDLGVSCNAGPCTHWWLNDVRVASRAVQDGSGADAFAVEAGRQIVATGSRFTGAAADGIDLKAHDVVIADTRIQAARNGVKLWHGGDVQDTAVTGTGADAALVGDGAGRYRYLRVSVTGHDPGGSGYVGTWGYDTQAPIRLSIAQSRFARNASGGLYLAAPAGSRIALVNNVFADRGAKLLEYGDTEIPATSAGLAAVVSLGWGRGNRLDR